MKKIINRLKNYYSKFRRKHPFFTGVILGLSSVLIALVAAGLLFIIFYTFYLISTPDQIVNEVSKSEYQWFSITFLSLIVIIPLGLASKWRSHIQVKSVYGLVIGLFVGLYFLGIPCMLRAFS